MAWTAELIKSLERLWTEGASTAEIGRKLGISKNAVVGKAHRLLLPPRPSPIKRAELPPSALKRNPRGPVCQWPIGDPKSADFHFCGEDAIPGRPYCPAHCAAAYASPKSSESAAA